MRIPAWLKILAVVLLLSMVGTALAAVSVYLVTTIAMVVLILFPGKDPRRPWIVRLVPWFWILGMIVALAALGANMLGKDIFAGADAHAPTPLELWMTVLITPPLVWSFFKRNAYFRPVLVSTTLISIGVALWVYMDSMRATTDLLDLVGNVSAELILMIYLLVKTESSLNNSASETASSG